MTSGGARQEEDKVRQQNIINLEPIRKENSHIHTYKMDIVGELGYHPEHQSNTSSKERKGSAMLCT